MLPNGLCMISLRDLVTNLVKKTKALIQCEYFPRGNSLSFFYLLSVY
ncbi:hypothetical protein TAESTU_30418 [Tenacibaculum aestuarii]